MVKMIALNSSAAIKLSHHFYPSSMGIIPFPHTGSELEALDAEPASYVSFKTYNTVVLVITPAVWPTANTSFPFVSSVSNFVIFHASVASFARKCLM